MEMLCKVFVDLSENHTSRSVRRSQLGARLKSKCATENYKIDFTKLVGVRKIKVS